MRKPNGLKRKIAEQKKLLARIEKTELEASESGYPFSLEWLKDRVRLDLAELVSKIGK